MSPNVGLTLLSRFGASSEGALASLSLPRANQVFRAIYKVPVHPETRMFPAAK